MRGPRRPSPQGSAEPSDHTTAPDDARRAGRPGTRWSRPYSTVRIDEVTYVIRPPRLADAEQWRAARLAERERLEPAFGAGSDWVAAHSDAAWAARWLTLRTAARQHGAHPAVVTADGRLIGEVGIDAVDERTMTGELSAWVGARQASAKVALWAGSTIALRGFTAPRPLRRLVAPVAVGNPSPLLILRALGFRQEIVLRDYAEYAGRRVDHRLLVLHNDEQTREQLRIGARVDPDPDHEASDEAPDGTPGPDRLQRPRTRSASE